MDGTDIKKTRSITILKPNIHQHSDTHKMMRQM